MIAGVGIDLCEIARMERNLTNGHFLTRFFAPEEQTYIQSKGRGAAQSMAGIFAAKEALTKVLGTGLTVGELADICVLHDEAGVPYYDLRGAVAEAAVLRGITGVFLSITHENGMAAAVAVAERSEAPCGY